MTKKYLPIICGVLLGLSAIAVNSVPRGLIAFGADDELNWWQTAVAGVENLDWGDIFGNKSVDTFKVQGLYKHVHGKTLFAPQEKAYAELAAKYGLTEDEAKAIVGGSLNTVYHNFATQSAGTNMSIADAIQRTEVFKQDYATIKELFDLEQEMDMTVRASEIFSNGDLKDSGFDLVYDLSLIEQILFYENTANSVGATFDSALDSPIIPGGGSGGGNNSGNNAGGTGGGSGAGGEVSAAQTASGSGSNLAGIEGDVATLNVADETIQAQILLEDVCKTDDGKDALMDALNEFEEKLPPDSDKKKSSKIDDGGDALNRDTQLVILDINETGEITINPAPKDDWGKPFCPEINSGTETGDKLGVSEMSSLGGATGEAYSYQAEGFSASATICIDVQLIEAAVTAADNSSNTACILCEVEKINQSLKEMLSHTLSPNKVTGNIFEAAKCADGMAPGESLGINLVDIKVIPIWTPVLTPPNDDLIFEQNIIEEWNQFIDRLGWDKLKADERYATEFETRYAAPDMSQAELFQNISANLLKNTNDKEGDLRSRDTLTTVSNTVIYTQNVLGEMRTMTGFFENFQRIYIDIYEKACKQLAVKKSQ